MAGNVCQTLQREAPVLLPLWAGGPRCETAHGPPVLPSAAAVPRSQTAPMLSLEEPESLEPLESSRASRVSGPVAAVSPGPAPAPVPAPAPAPAPWCMVRQISPATSTNAF